jgi:hypothetical protein
MIRSLRLLLAVPFGSAVAQDSAVYLRVTSSNRAAFRIIRSGRDSVERPLVARGRVDVVAELPAARPVNTPNGMEITAVDTTTMIHVEATQNGRVIASGDEVYLTVHRDSSGIAIEAGSSVPAAVVRTLPRPQ